jgi:excisionase family DNA binding protein
MSPHLYTVDQVAERLNLHAKTVRRYIRDGRPKAKRIGKDIASLAPTWTSSRARPIRCPSCGRAR